MRDNWPQMGTASHNKNTNPLNQNTNSKYNLSPKYTDVNESITNYAPKAFQHQTDYKSVDIK